MRISYAVFCLKNYIIIFFFSFYTSPPDLPVLPHSFPPRHSSELDLGQWSATVEAPATYDYHGYTVAKCGPWSQGPLMLQQLALLRDIPLAEMAADGPEFVHTMVEAAKLAFADREAWYGDAEGFEVPLETLLYDSYNAQRRALIGARASADFRPGSPDGRRPRLPSYRIADENSIDINAILGVGEPTVAEAGEPLTETTGVMRGDLMAFYTAEIGRAHV